MTKELSKGFTGIEINGVRFSNLKEMLIYMDKQRYCIIDLEKKNAELKSENQKWKDEWQEQVQKANDEGYARTLQTIQLTKAKEIIKELMSFSVQLCDCRHTVDFEKTREEAKQFLSEVNK